MSASLGWWKETSDGLVESSLRVAIATSGVVAGIAPITAIAYRRKPAVRGEAADGDVGGKVRWYSVIRALNSSDC